MQLDAYMEFRAIKSTTHAKNIGVIKYGNLGFSDHIKAITKSEFWYIWNIAKMRDVVAKHDLMKHIHSFISCRDDFCNSLLTGLSKWTIRQLQLIQTSAAIISQKPRKLQFSGPYSGFQVVRYRIKLKVLLVGTQWFRP